jgi:hypothetical protein
MCGMTKVNPLSVASLIAGAQRYAAADPSDPFVFARARAHIRIGLCNRIFLQNGEPSEGHYNAEEISITENGVLTKSWKNRVRP